MKGKAELKWNNRTGKGKRLGETLCDSGCMEGGVQVSQWEEKDAKLLQIWLPNSILPAPFLEAAGGADGMETVHIL